MVFVPKYILVLFFLITLDYFLAFLIDSAEGRKKKIFLIASICANLGTLFVFKYFNFFNENFAMLAKFLHFNYEPFLLTIIVPLGLSFHIFQSLCYIIEVYKKKYEPERNYITYALYVLFFPQLVAGPIERPAHLLPQLNTHMSFDYLKARRGLERIMWGFFKKLVIADQFSRIISALFVHLPTDSITLILMMIMFTYQLYCDFSGYSDIAVGSAMLFGFELTENFNRPFSARTITELWRKWHISLSTWLKDYLYYPIVFGFGRITKPKLYTSLFITFSLIGLWHGASWTYLIFGSIQGIYLIIESMTEKARLRVTQTIGLTKFPKIHKGIDVVITFCLFGLSLVFFRSQSVSDALWILKHIFTLPQPAFFMNQVFFNPMYIPLVKIFVPAAFAVIFMEVVQYIQAKNNTYFIFESKGVIVRHTWYYAITISTIMLGYLGAQSFIYFKF